MANKRNPSRERPASATSKVPPRPSQQKRRPSGKQARQARTRRNRRFAWLGGVGGVAVVAAVIALVAVASGGSGHEQMPASVTGGSTDTQPTALVVPDTSGISGVVAYDTAGWPSASQNGPAGQALGHTHVDGHVAYSVIPPVGGDHNAEWMNCGVYDQPVPNERALHNLEHGAVWITYQPDLAPAEVQQLLAFEAHQSRLQGGSRYIDVSPYPGLPSPIVVSSWGFQLRLASPTDPRLQQFVDKFRNSATFSPEYQAPCTGGTGHPLQS